MSFGLGHRLALVCASVVPAGAGAETLWEFFEARCLVPYEHIALPDVRGLTEDSGLWVDAGEFALRLTPESCAALGRSVDVVLAEGLAGRQAYEEVAPGVWQSHLWREPRIEVEVVDGAYVVRETDLES